MDNVQLCIDTCRQATQPRKIEMSGVLDSTDCRMGNVLVAGSVTFAGTRGMSLCGRTSPYTSAPGCSHVLAVNGKLTLKPRHSRLIQNKNTLIDRDRPNPVIENFPQQDRNVLNSDIQVQAAIGSLTPRLGENATFSKTVKIFPLEHKQFFQHRPYMEQLGYINLIIDSLPHFQTSLFVFTQPGSLSDILSFNFHSICIRNSTYDFLLYAQKNMR